MRFFLLALFGAILSCTGKTITTDNQTIMSGKQLVFTREKGNCLACHAIKDGESPGNIGPPLEAIQTKFKDKQQLRQQIWDATQFNSNTSMPPYGKNKILTEQEIDKVVDFIWQLP
jgi:sulfur-oxidizing protein SoxX